MKKKRMTWEKAHGNKRTKRKIRELARGCGCNYCCPEDNRRDIRDKLWKKERKEFINESNSRR